MTKKKSPGAHPQGDASHSSSAAGVATPAATSLDGDDFLRGLHRDGKPCVVGPVKLQSRISRGGMGIVYRGRHVKLDIDVAVKFLLPHLAESNPEYVIRFEREARMAAQINNENLVRVFDVDSEKDYHYVVMELVCGETARDRVARKGPLSESEAMEIIIGATRGLEAAHRKGIVHRDIKPENIMIDATGVVKLADLGIAKMLGEAERGSNLTQPGFVMGTPSFMPPEQFTESSAVNFAGDVYSMGATLYFLLTGKPPFSGTFIEVYNQVSVREFPDVRKERPEISERIVAILRRATSRQATVRYPDANTLLEALETSGTTRLNLHDAETGTVTAVARVSTPPARRVGEIRLHVPGDGSGPAPGVKDGTGSRPVGPVPAYRKRGILLVAGIIVLGLLFLGGLFAFRKSPPQQVDRDFPAGRAAPLPSSPPVSSVTAPPEKKEAPARRPAPAEAKPREQPVQPRDAREPVKESVKAAKQEGPSPEQLLARLRQLVHLGQIDGAGNLVKVLRDRGVRTPEVLRLHARVLLRASPPREAEVRRLLESACAEPGAAVADSACEGGYQEVLAYVTSLPPTSFAPEWEARLTFLRSLPVQPNATIASAYHQARKAIAAGYVRSLARSATAALVASEDTASARKTLDAAGAFIERESLQAELGEESASLAAARKNLERLQTELDDWKSLVPGLVPTDSGLPKLDEAVLKERKAKFDAFALRYPDGSRCKKAKSYGARYQSEIDRRTKTK